MWFRINFSKLLHFTSNFLTLWQYRLVFGFNSPFLWVKSGLVSILLLVEYIITQCEYRFWFLWMQTKTNISSLYNLWVSCKSHTLYLDIGCIWMKWYETKVCFHSNTYYYIFLQHLLRLTNITRYFKTRNYFTSWLNVCFIFS